MPEAPPVMRMVRPSIFMGLLAEKVAPCGENGDIDWLVTNGKKAPESAIRT